MSDEDPSLHGPSPKTKTETRGFQDQDQDYKVQEPRPRPRLVKTSLETSRDQDSNLVNSKSAKTIQLLLAASIQLINPCSAEAVAYQPSSDG